MARQKVKQETNSLDSGRELYLTAIAAVESAKAAVDALTGHRVQQQQVTTRTRKISEELKSIAKVLHQYD